MFVSFANTAGSFDIVVSKDPITYKNKVIYYLTGIINV